MVIFKKLHITLLVLQFICLLPILQAQQINCNYFTPLVQINFGNTSQSKEINLSYLHNYKKTNSQCPDDGYFTYTNFTSNCFNGNWHTLQQDHTFGDTNGNMMLVNAADNPGIFFNTSITGLTANSTYQLTAWFVNICKRGRGCTPTPPNILITIFCNGKMLASFETGNMEQNDYPIWKKYESIFTLPQNTNKLLLQMKDLTIGGCGNDFALDDIELKECIVKKNTPIILPSIIPTKKVAALPKPIKQVTASKRAQKIQPIKTTPKFIEPTIVKQLVELPTLQTIPITNVFSARETPIIKWIKTPPTDIAIDIYDNGEIDGDTVSVYHNNICIKNNIGISAKPISFTINITPTHPHHEIILVANNEGSIPPNTSLMVVTAAGKRYEVFITASNKKNAKLVFDLE
jgi:hypothetical protein